MTNVLCALVSISLRSLRARYKLKMIHDARPLGFHLPKEFTSALCHKLYLRDMRVKRFPSP